MREENLKGISVSVIIIQYARIVVKFKMCKGLSSVLVSEEGYQDQESLDYGTTDYFLHSPSQFALANPPERLLNMKITMERGACLQTHGSCKVCKKELGLTRFLNILHL